VLSVYIWSAKTHIRSYRYGYGGKLSYTDTVIRRIWLRRTSVCTILASPKYRICCNERLQALYYPSLILANTTSQKVTIWISKQRLRQVHVARVNIRGSGMRTKVRLHHYITTCASKGISAEVWKKPETTPSIC